jgi:hypothetical protein
MPMEYHGVYLDVKWSGGVAARGGGPAEAGHYVPPKRGLTIGLKIDPKV